jgi:hypothetical protein
MTTDGEAVIAFVPGQAENAEGGAALRECIW